MNICSRLIIPSLRPCVSARECSIVATNGASPWNGSSWATAFTNVHDALNVAEGGVIYLAGHAFALTNQLVWTATEGLTIRGGYAATNSADTPGPSDPEQWPTVLTRANPAVNHRILQIQSVTNGTLEAVPIHDGRVTDNGAGLNILNSSLTISRCDIHANTASSGASPKGGGIYFDGGTLLLTNSVIRDNAVVGTDNGWGDGGGIWVNTGVFIMRDSELLENRAMTGWRAPYGGGLHNVNGSVSLVNCLISANRCLNASAINNSLGNLHILNCTITDNLDGPAARRAAGALSITNSILWYNASDLSGTISLGYSNIQDGNGAGSNGNISSNPLFEFGYYLADGSPSRDTGTNATFLLDSGYTTRITGEHDTGIVDMGYHYRQGTDLGFADIYVSSSGSDANSGTNWPETFQTITHALTKVMSGSRVHVAAGTYTHPGETFPLTFSGVQGVSLLGAGSGETIINATGSGQRVLTWHVGGSSRIEGITVTGGYADRGGGIHFLGASDVLVRDCIVSGNTISKDHPFGGGTLSVTNSILWNNTTADVNGDVAIAYSLIGTGTGIGINENISTDPLFTDAAGGDYRLGSGSPAANKGIAQDWMTGATDRSSPRTCFKPGGSHSA